MTEPRPNTDPWLSISHFDGTREQVRLTLALTTIGRSEQNVIELLDPKLSRFHCEIERRAEGHTVRDCSSRNGTLVNGEPCAGRRLLRDGDRIKIGRTVFTFTRDRPPELRDDTAVGFRPYESGEETVHMERRERPTGSLDRRQTQAVEVPLRGQEKAWRFLSRVSLELADATSRGELIERVLENAQQLFQSRGALVVLGQSAEAMGLTASLGLEGEDKQRCLDMAGRVLTSRKRIADGRATYGVPLRGSRSLEGALVLCDLANTPASDATEVSVLETLADLAGRTLTGSLRIEEVRREERADDARRIAHDLRLLIRPEARQLDALEVGVSTSSSPQIGTSFWDRVVAPERAGRQETYFALGDVPDAEAPATGRLRRRGERSFVSLLGQAELRGALRSMVEILPRTSDLLAELNRAVHREGCVDRMALTLCRFDPERGTVRWSGAGHEPILVRQPDGTVHALEALAPVIGAEPVLHVAEQDLRLGPGDQVLFASAGCTHAAKREDLASLFSRLGGTAHSAQEVAERLTEGLARQSLSEPAECALLLLRKV